MTFKHVMNSVMLLLLISFTVAAQTPIEDKQKKDREAAEKKVAIEKKALAMVDEIIKEIASLRLNLFLQSKSLSPRWTKR